MLATFIFDFFLFLGIKLHYIDFYQIPLYYNILFADNQNIYLYFGLSFLFVYIIIYLKNLKFKTTLLVLAFLISLTPLIQPIGYEVGMKMFMQKNTLLKNTKFTFKGDIYYIGRQSIYFYDTELQKMITLQKKDLLP
jgi:hypothetical protein